jgi:hypothetical protein
MADVAAGRFQERIDYVSASSYLDDMEEAEREVATLAAATGSRDPEIGLLEVLEVLQVDNARANGWSWQQIASRLGVSKQAVHQKYSLRSQTGRKGQGR